MSDRSKSFFVWVWRINGLGVLALVLAATVGVIALLIESTPLFFREPSAEKLDHVAGTDLNEEDLHLDQFLPVPGTRLLHAELTSSPEGFSSGSGRGYGEARNLLYFDTVSKKANWLFPTHDQVIRSRFFLMDRPEARFDRDEDEADSVTLAMVLEMESLPGRSEGHEVVRSLAIATADGRTVTPIADSIGRLIGHHQPTKESSLLFYVSDGAARVLDLDPTTRTVRSDDLLSSQ